MPDQRRQRLITLSCPCCYREMHIVCHNTTCACQERVPAGELPMVNLEHDIEACPYCGFAAHVDFWFCRNLEEAQLFDGLFVPQKEPTKV